MVAPRFQRRRERLWAWRARPSRPAIYALGVVIALGLFGRFVAPQLGNLGSGYDADPYGYGYGGYAPSAAAAAVASCTRPGACNEWVDPDGQMLSALRSTCEQSGQQFAEGPCARTNITGRCQAAGGHLFMFWYPGAPPGEDQKHACDTMRGSYSTTP